MNDSRVRELLKQAIETMRYYMDTASREIDRDDITDERMIERVLHAFGWGHANATSSLINAVNDLECQREREDAEANVAGKAGRD